MKTQATIAEIKSVSSASKPEEEEAAILSSDSSTCSANTGSAGAEQPPTSPLKVRPVIQQQQQQQQPDFDKPKVAPSPAPVPVQGGDDEVIRVSHVRKIIINTNTTTSTSTSTKEPSPASALQSNPAPPREEPKDRTKSNESSKNHHTPGHHNHHTSIEKKKQQKTMSRRHAEMSDDEEESESSSDSEPMDVIEKSPYEANMDAEKGEELFTRMKHVLKERKEGNDYGTLDAEATRIFGGNAWSLVKANALIEKSGMVYSQEWCNGNIRGNYMGKIPLDLLLLCLVSNRLAKAQDLLLSGLTRDFEVTGIVQEAIKTWKLSGYDKILGVSNKNMQFQTRRRDCYKCAIFVGRAYGCYKAFSTTKKLESSLMAKIKTCLDMMELHLQEPSASSKKKRKSEELAATIVTSSKEVPNKVASDSATGEPPKRKRGRPRKNPPLNTAAKAPDNGDDIVSKDSLVEDYDGMVPYNPPKKRGRTSSSVSKKANKDLSDEEVDDDDDMVPYNPPVRGSNGKARKSSTANSTSGTKTKSTAAAVIAGTSTNSLSNLVSKFEAQYEAMGEAYKQMGFTLQELKSKIQENRTATEEEIRNELLLEVQDNLLRSFGKK